MIVCEKRATESARGRQGGRGEANEGPREFDLA
jgi:hypothetical protein